MSLSDELKTEVAKIFHDVWQFTDGRVVPEPDAVPFGNRGVLLDGTVLYADLTQSTGLVDKYKKEMAAEVYKTYLHCAGKIIRNEGGVITAYDGDRIMAVFLGENKDTLATRAALKIEYARTIILNPAFKNHYPTIDYSIRHTVGVATSQLLAARTGVRGANDLVWVGSAANHAAKLTTLPEFPIWITKPVFDRLAPAFKGSGVWQARRWTEMNQMIYGTTHRSTNL